MQDVPIPISEPVQQLSQEPIQANLLPAQEKEISNENAPIIQPTAATTALLVKRKYLSTNFHLNFVANEQINPSSFVCNKFLQPCCE